MCWASGRFVEPLAAFVDSTCGPVAVRKEKNGRLTANFAHAQPAPFVRL